MTRKAPIRTAALLLALGTMIFACTPTDGTDLVNCTIQGDNAVQTRMVTVAECNQLGGTYTARGNLLGV